MIKVFFVFGTRPEAIKMCPLVLHLRERGEEFDVRVCVTGQHRGMLDSVLGRFNVSPDYDLDVMTPNQNLSTLTASVLQRLDPILAKAPADYILVQGDTTTTFAGALAGFYRQIPVAHIEAGLRTGDITQPFPEEMNRVLTSRLCQLHFAPTQRAKQNLLSEGVPVERVEVTGNTGIDALLYANSRLECGEWAGYDGVLASDKRLVLVTAHRRENFGDGIANICAALKRIASRGDAEIVLPVHRNPNVKTVFERELAEVAGIRLIEPLDYVAFVDVMRRSSLLLTDSGGVQEEAPSLGKPVLVMRDKTERQEAVEAGTAYLVGTDPDTIVREVGLLLDQAGSKERARTLQNPFGDGHACERIAMALLRHHSGRESVQLSSGVTWTAFQHA